MRRTKIVCTLGPAVDTKEKVKLLIEAGMNVARINCSHGNWEQRKQWIEWIRELSPDIAPIAILCDLQGPKFRIGDLPNGALDILPGEKITIGNGGVIPITQPEILKVMAPGGRLLLGDGEIEFKILSGNGTVFEAEVITGGTLKSKKGVTLVNQVFETPALTEKDVEDAIQAVSNGTDFIALSYVKNSADVRELRRVVDRLDPAVRICAKIETREAIDELEHILKVVDLVMVARGDLGLQMDIEDVPLMQKRIINACTLSGKPVITATQMLESMMTNPRPTRAEASDVANAILDGTDAVMLSGETAAGAYPIECVKTMARIAVTTEPHLDRSKMDRWFWEHARTNVSHTDAIAHAADRLSSLLGCKAIVTTTTSGQTPRLVSKFRPVAPILTATWNKKTHRQLAVVWGVQAVHIELPETTDETINCAIDAFMRKKQLNPGDQVVVTAGAPAGAEGNTNLIMTLVVK